MALTPVHPIGWIQHEGVRTILHDSKEHKIVVSFYVKLDLIPKLRGISKELADIHFASSMYYKEFAYCHAEKELANKILLIAKMVG